MKIFIGTLKHALQHRQTAMPFISVMKTLVGEVLTRSDRTPKVKMYLKRANPTERRGRKITSLRDQSHDSGIAGCDAHLLARDHMHPRSPLWFALLFLFQYFQ